MKSVFSGSGYLLVDDRASGGRLVEADMLGCNHCQALLKKNEWREDGGHCGGCMQPVCGPCADKILTHGCEPFLRQLEAALERDYTRAQNARMMCT